MMRTIRLTLPALALLLASPALANEGGGLPQLDTQWYAAQVFWLVVHFIALYFIASKLILPRIGAALERREGRIATDLEQAERLQKEAETARHAYESELATARQDGLKLREQALQAAQAERVAAESRLMSELASRASEAHTRLEHAKQEMRVRMREVAAEAAASITLKLTGQPADRAVIDSALAQLCSPTTLREVA